VRAAVVLQYLLPHRALSRLVYWATRWTWRPWKDFLIGRVIRSYNVDMSQALQSDPKAYASFNAFFTRALKPDARPQPADPRAIACPADGRISQIGAIVTDAAGPGRVFQAKGFSFSAAELLGDVAAAQPYKSGNFVTVYLSPRDYHRLHMPCDGRLTRMIYVPGALFSVNPVTARGVPNLFARNERVVCLFESPEHGPFVMVLVGATIVGSMATVWHGVVNPPRTREPRSWEYQGRDIVLAKGA